tara:strand:- start:402 stop:1382 length:981 start_codon:yes stop_codon:yes gene_type:complete
MNFLHPFFLWLLLLIPLLVIFYFYIGRIQYSSIRIPFSVKGLTNLKSKFFRFLFVLRVMAIILIIIALARPQTQDVSEDSLKKEGVDIMIAMDISSSMLAEDFKPNRLEAAKELAIEFIKGRKSDRIGLVTYAAESFTQCPLTTDHDVLINMMNNVKTGLLTDGTAIGLGIGNCVNRLKSSKAKSKIIILLTDGENNSGVVDPITAASMAREFNIKTYTIGVGSYGTAPYPGKDIFGRSMYYDVPSNIDEDMLRLVADTTGAVYFRADKKSKLAKVYEEIELLEKTEIEEIKFYNVTEKYFIFCLLAFILFVVEIVLDYTVFKRIV